ncbi:MAG: response regulator [Chloroflexi bacterium]|nr:response regulator [Chloroflexota bacterium]
MTRPRLVVADDSALARAVLRHILEGAGYDVSLASSAQQALAQVREQVPAAIVLDLVMPRVSGADACRTLKADATTASLPVILLSASEDELGHAAEARADAVCAKSSGFPELLAALRQLVPVGGS